MVVCGRISNLAGLVMQLLLHDWVPIMKRNGACYTQNACKDLISSYLIITVESNKKFCLSYIYADSKNEVTWYDWIK